MDESILEKIEQFKQAMTESLQRSVARHPEYDADKLRSQMQPIFDNIEQASAEVDAVIEQGKEEVRSPLAGNVVIDNDALWKPFSPPKPKGATSIDEFIAQAPQGPGSKEIFEEWIIDVQLRVSGNLAQAWVRYGARFGDPGDISEWEGIDAVTLINHDGNWKIASLAFASDQ